MSPRPLTRILRDALGQSGADRETVHELAAVEIRRLARAAMRHPSTPVSLQLTQLVNEVWLKMARQHPDGWKDRHHFVAWASQAIRSNLVDLARARAARKRKAEGQKVPLSDGLASVEGPRYELLALDEALDQLATVDPKGARIIELHYFAGLSQQQVAETLGLDRTTVARRSALARAWLKLKLGED